MTSANRLDLSDVTSFVAAVIQAEQLGVSIAKVLRIQSDQMRIRRRQRAEEKAHQAPVENAVPDGLSDLPGDLDRVAWARLSCRPWRPTFRSKPVLSDSSAQAGLCCEADMASPSSMRGFAQLQQQGRQAWSWFIDLLFPPRCGGCQTAGSLWCEACRAAVKPIEPPWCEKCGETLCRRSVVRKLPGASSSDRENPISSPVSRAFCGRPFIASSMSACQAWPSRLAKCWPITGARSSSPPIG